MIDLPTREADPCKEYAQIVVRAGTFQLYQPDGWEVVFEDSKLLTIRRLISGSTPTH